MGLNAQNKHKCSNLLIGTLINRLSRATRRRHKSCNDRLIYRKSPGDVIHTPATLIGTMLNSLLSQVSHMAAAQYVQTSGRLA